MTITSFKGDYAFLSNFYPVEIKPFENMGVFPTLEHAYVAYKTEDEGIREFIRNIETPGKVKRYGRSELVIDPKYWTLEKRKYVMTILVEHKFEPYSQMAQKLIDTSGRELIEGNQHGDTFWGQCPLGTGQNHLGKTLMRHRDVLTLFYT